MRITGHLSSMQWLPITSHGSLQRLERCAREGWCAVHEVVQVGGALCCVDAIEKVRVSYLSDNESGAGHSLNHCYRTRMRLRPLCAPRVAARWCFVCGDSVDVSSCADNGAGGTLACARSPPARCPVRAELRQPPLHIGLDPLAKRAPAFGRPIMPMSRAAW